MLSNHNSRVSLNKPEPSLKTCFHFEFSSISLQMSTTDWPKSLLFPLLSIKVRYHGAPRLHRDDFVSVQVCGSCCVMFGCDYGMVCVHPDVSSGGASCAGPGGRSGRSSGCRRCIWRVSLRCVSGSVGWARLTGRNASRSFPMCSGTASHLQGEEERAEVLETQGKVYHNR